VSQRVDARRRTKATTASKLRPFWILFVIGLLIVLGLAAFVVAWPGFAPKSIAVSGNRLVSRDDIVSHARVSMHTNMWLQDPNAIARRIEEIPYVAQATVHRLPPATIAVWVTERTPFAIVRAGGNAALVDRDLRVLSPAPAGASSLEFDVAGNTLPPPGGFLSDPAIVAMRDDYDALLAAHVVPLRLGVDKYGGLVVTIRGGTQILLGEDTGLAKKISLIGPILSQVSGKGRSLAIVDLRAPNTPVVRYK